jgi:hypothetical protein
MEGLQKIHDLLMGWFNPRQIRHLTGPGFGTSSSLDELEAYDLLYAIGVGETWPEEQVEASLAKLCQGPVIVWASNFPGQCPTPYGRWPEWWAEQFAKQGYVPVDVLRPLLWDDPEVHLGLKQNVLLFIRDPLVMPGYMNLDPIVHQATYWTRPERLTMVWPMTTSPPLKPGVSLLTVVRNEAQRIRGMLDSLLVDGEPIVDEIVLVDQQSTDDTVNIVADWAGNYGLPLTYRIAAEIGYSELSRPLGVALCEHEWILNLDADEQLTPELAQSLPEYTCSRFIGGWRIRRKSTIYTPGGTLIDEVTEDVQLRLARRLRMPPQGRMIHTTLVVTGPSGLIEQELLHTKSAQEALDDNRRYQEIITWEHQNQLIRRIEEALASEASSLNAASGPLPEN